MTVQNPDTDNGYAEGFADGSAAGRHRAVEPPKPPKQRWLDRGPLPRRRALRDLLVLHLRLRPLHRGAHPMRRVKVEGDLFHGRVPDGAVYVGRQAPGLPRSPFANPYSVRVEGLERSRDAFRAIVLPALDVELLRGRDLACWCPLDAEWCHADDLLDAANR